MLVVTLKFVSFHALANMFQPPNLEQNVAAASHDRVLGSLFVHRELTPPYGM